jgi:hypothetical protein
LYCYRAISPSFSSAELWCQLFQVCHHHINKTCILTFYSLYSNNSHFSLNIFTVARFKLVGKKRTKAKAPAKQGQDNRRSHHQVSTAAAAAAAAAAPVTAPANDTVVPPAGFLGTNASSGISAPSATAATTTVIAAATSSVAGANMPDFCRRHLLCSYWCPFAQEGFIKGQETGKRIRSICY